jgi:HSP90 family molecular chaperone
MVRHPQHVHDGNLSSCIADDLPLSVGRDSIQTNVAVSQIKRAVARKVGIGMGLLHDGLEPDR